MKTIQMGPETTKRSIKKVNAQPAHKARWLVSELINLENAALALNLADPAILIEQAIKSIDKDLRLGMGGKNRNSYMAII